MPAHLKDTSKAIRLAMLLGWNDVQQTYKRSKIGPFWISIGSSVGILTVTLVYGAIFRVEISYFLPYISTSMLAWNFMATIISESANAYVSAEGIIKQIKMPIFVHNLRVIWRNAAIAAHNLLVLPIVYIATGFTPSATFLLFPAYLALVSLNLGWLSVIISIASTRFRDLGPTVSNLLQVAFYVTPVIWMASSLQGSVAHYLLGLNPLYHWLQLLRLPLLNESPTIENVLISLVGALTGWAVAGLAIRKFERKISLWL